MPVIGGGDEILLPGFINGHHHVGLTPCQLGSPDMPLELWFVTRMVFAQPQPVSRHAVFRVRDDRVRYHHGAAHPWLGAGRVSRGGSGGERGDPSVSGHRDAGVVFVRGARPEPAGVPGGRRFVASLPAELRPADAALV